MVIPERPSETSALGSVALDAIWSAMHIAMGRGNRAAPGIVVSAATRLLEHCRWAEENSTPARVITWLGGPEKALEYLSQNREALEAECRRRLAIRALPEKVADESEK